MDLGLKDKVALVTGAGSQSGFGKGTSPMDIAAAVAYLASDLSGDITGQVLSISGGSTMQ